RPRARRLRRRRAVRPDAARAPHRRPRECGAAPPRARPARDVARALAGPSRRRRPERQRHPRRPRAHLAPARPAPGPAPRPAAPDRPLRIVLAGKAHRNGDAGKWVVRHVWEMAHDPRFAGRIVFLEDYEMTLARYLVEGVDVWLNTPRRPQEASGTSGMKA